MSSWKLDSTGDVGADITCPHGHAVEYLNKRDFEYTREEDPNKVTRKDLTRWLKDHREELPEYCMGH